MPVDMARLSRSMTNVRWADTSAWQTCYKRSPPRPAGTITCAPWPPPCSCWACAWAESLGWREPGESLGSRPTESATGRTAHAQHPITSQTQLQHQRREAWRTNLWASSCGVPNEGTDRYHRNPRHSRALGARVPTGPGTMIAQPPESRECNQTHGSSHHDENTVPAFNRLGSVAQPLLNRRCSTLPRTEG